MTQTIKCDICHTTEDAVKVGEQYQQQLRMFQQMAMEAKMYGMEFEEMPHKGWMTIYDTDLCPKCLEEYREHSDPLKEQMKSEKAEVDAQYKDAATGILATGS